MLTYCNLTNRVPKYMCIDSMHFLPVNIYFKNKNWYAACTVLAAYVF